MKDRIQNVTPKDYKGVHYRSTLEADTARTLDKMGIPFEYETRKITLLDGFKCPYQKERVRAITYTPDFLIGPIILECKGFETPEWKNKKKYLYKYLMENEPDTIFYQIKNSKSQLLAALDKHWSYLGYAIKVTSKPNNKKPNAMKTERCFGSVAEAMEILGLKGKPLGTIVKSLMGLKPFVYGYNWKLLKIQL